MMTRMLPESWPTRWWLLRDGAADGAADGAHNMAVDAALMARAARTGDGFLRIYGWNRPTVSFGRNEAARRHFTPDSLAAAGFDAVRRPTGGRALLHGRDVTYSVALPFRAGSGWRSAYALVNARLVDGLRAMGVDATLAPAAVAPLAPEGALCFAAPDAGEIVVGARKLVGSAVWREAGAYLQHGSILTVNDQPLLARAGVRGDATPPPAPEVGAAVGLRELLGSGASGAEQRTSDLAERVTTALADAFDVGRPRDVIGESVTLDDREPSYLADIERLEAHFRSSNWLWRR